MRATDQSSKRSKAGLLGVGLDGSDGHTRITRGDNFLLLGGSSDTHEVMQETAIKLNEELKSRRTTLDAVSAPELRDILHLVHDQIHGH